MITISVTATYTCSTDTMVDLPEGKTWEDVVSWNIKWGKHWLRPERSIFLSEA